jgi:hypothetical protein
MKRLTTIIPAAVLLSVVVSLASAEGKSYTIYQAFHELARLEGLKKVKEYDIADSHDRELMAQSRKIRSTLLQKPTSEILAAIDRSIHGSDKVEIAGALDIYGDLVTNRRAVRNPQYKPLLLDMLARDDFELPSYTAAARGALLLFPSRETMVAWMDAAKRAPNEEIREGFILMAAGILDIELRYSTSDPPERRRQVLDAFVSWYEKNQDRIRFDKNGGAHFRGGPEEWKPPKLSAHDKTRIKADPVCVLHLFEKLQDPQDPEPGAVDELNTRCGRALLGDEGSLALANKIADVKSKTPTTLEEEISMSAASVNYPAVSAALTAVAYVASMEPIDPAAKKLAIKILDDFGDGLEEILKEEPASVRRKVDKLMEADNP